MSSQQDLIATIELQQFRLDIVKVERIPASTTVQISYNAFGPEALNSLTDWDYSTDMGATWSIMTLQDPSQVDNIAFSQSGSLNLLVWEGYADLGMGLFNEDIMIRLRATDSVHDTPYEVDTFTIPKRPGNGPARDPILDASFNGLPGNKLIKDLFSRVR